MEILGYSDRFGVRGGEAIAFKVGTTAPSYRAELVQFDRAFSEPEPDRDTVVPATFAGDYPGQKQEIPIGSYVVVPDTKPVRFDRGLTIQAWISPGVLERPWNQGCLARWDAATGSGFGLGLDPGGLLVLWLGDGNGGRSELVADAPLVAHCWYFVAATYDAATGRAGLHWTKLRRGWLPFENRTTAGTVGPLVPGEGPLLLGAAQLDLDGNGKPAPRGCFNGKIDRPRLWDRALTPAEITALRDGGDPLAVADGLVAAWDFARDITTRDVTDTSPNGRHGQTVNAPARAMIGANWDGSEVAFRLAPDRYGAIAFHEDDLEDADWNTDFVFEVPVDLPSGLYAARLTAGHAIDYVPFYVRPAAGGPTAPVLFLAPTNTYLAYANERLFHGIENDPEFVEKATDYDVKLTVHEHFMDAHPELGSSLYDKHPDGTGICYSSRLRPIYTMRPWFLNWINGCTRHFSSDLYLLEWLKQQGIPYDVATDEDLHLEGTEALDPYKVVLTGGHPEYWTTPMLDALETYLARGGRMMYLGGNGFYWVTAIDPARPHLIEVRRGINGTRSWTSHPGEIALSLTGEPGGLWRYRGRTPNALTGVGFASEGWGGAEGYHRLPASHDPRAAFVFAGIGDDEVIGDFGFVMNGAAGDEIDRWDPDFGTPPETLRLATSEGRHTDYYQLVIEDLRMIFPGRGGTEDPRVRADITLTESPSGGAAFSVGSINWIGSLPSNDGDNNVSRVTENVLRRFASLEGKGTGS
jgi:N,N-dimethylformamidase